jgi:hypothetical protein
VTKGTRRVWGVSVTSRPLITAGKDLVPIIEEAGWAPGAGLDERKISPPPGFDPRTVQPVVSLSLSLSLSLSRPHTHTHTHTNIYTQRDKLAKEAAQEADDQNIVNARIPTTSVATELKKEGIVKWQRQWESTEKGAVCRLFFPSVEQRLKMRLPITPKFTAIVTSHRKTKSYLHRFKLTDNPTCPCNEGIQTPEHLIYDCKLIEVQRSSLKQHIMADGGNWPTPKRELVASYLKILLKICQIHRFQ